MIKKLAIVTTHPIQYYAPLFKLLAIKVELKVFYTWGKASIEKFDPGFGKIIQWDIPLLDGYDYLFLCNTSKVPGSHHYNGIKNPTITHDIEVFNPDALLVFGWCYQSHFKVLRHFKKKIPIYFRGDSTLLDNDASTLAKKAKLLLRQISLKIIYKYVDQVFYVGYNNKKYFEWVGLKSEQLIFTPHAIENNRFLINDFHIVKKQKELLQIPESAIVILFAGKLEEKKNPSLLIHSFNSLSQNNIHLIFLGNGKNENELKRYALNSRKKNQIHFVDFQNQTLMPIWYNLSDIFCLPSKGPGETWGLAVNEAMAVGKAIIVSDKVGCSIDLVRHNVNGWVFESENESQLISILNNLPSKDVLQEMGKKSSEIIKMWSLDILANNMVKSFTQV